MIKITIVDAFGEPMEIECQIGEAKVHGYEKEGSWSLYGGEGWVPCTYVAVRPKGKRKFRWIMKSRIVSGFPECSHDR